MRTTEKENGSLLRELAAILRDYQDRIDRIGPEAFRLRGESFEAWDRKQKRIALVLELLEVAAKASVRGQADALLRELVDTPNVALPPDLAKERP